MNEQELKQMIEGILTEMSGGKTTDTVAAAPTKSVVETVVTEGSIPDITEVDIKKQLLVPEPADREGYLKMKQMTPARLGLWRAGPRYKTETILRFRADHAVAQDSVFSYVSEDLVKEMNFIPVNTKCQDKDEYLTRPDLGREFDDEMVEVIRANTTKNAKLQIVVGDGLSSAAIEANIKDILPSIKQGLKM
ncbi:ethanolamine ammonia-lyase, partial [Listeria monocytogenes]|nr:ethanolamine ammonia-lyase [Listeria monocytogenes]